MDLISKRERNGQNNSNYVRNIFFDEGYPLLWRLVVCHGVFTGLYQQAVLSPWGFGSTEGAAFKKVAKSTSCLDTNYCLNVYCLFLVGLNINHWFSASLLIPSQVLILCTLLALWTDVPSPSWQEDFSLGLGARVSETLLEEPTYPNNEKSSNCPRLGRTNPHFSLSRCLLGRLLQPTSSDCTTCGQQGWISCTWKVQKTNKILWT